MSTLASDIEKELGSLDRESARHFERAVREMLLMARQKSALSQFEFEQLAAEEAAVREMMRREGRAFSAGTRLTREDLHDRHALR